MTSPPVRWLLAVALCSALAALCVSRSYPPLPNPLTLEFVLDPAKHGNQSDPIITAGVAGRADFLYLHRADPGVIFIGYDSWNSDRSDSARLPLANGTRHRLRIEMPGLNQIHGRYSGRQPGRIRVWLDEALVLDDRAHFYVRDADAIQIGENPLGGSTAEPHFGGKLFDASGREIRGGAREIFSWRARVSGWLQYAPGQAITLLLLCLALGRHGARLQTTNWSDLWATIANAVRRHRAFVGSTAVCAFVFTWFVTMGSFDFGFPESFCTFYDFQARSLLQGQLDVPEESLSGEAFVVDGRNYGYFGLTPALLRLPFAVFDVGLGRLSRAFMLLDYVGALLAAYLVFLTARRFSASAPTAPRGAWTTVFVINAGLGSTLLFLGSRSYIYHEAIMCGAMFALFAVWCALRFWLAPCSRWWVGALICGALSVHARPPTGLFALSLLGLFALLLALRQRAARPLVIAAWCLVAVVSFNAVAYLKFKTFDGQPLRYNKNYNPERLAKFGENKFHLSNIPYVAHAYLLGPSFRLTPEFPWFRAEPKPTWRPAWTRMDMIEPTVGFPFTMPGLLLLALIGGAVAWRAQPEARGPLTVLVFAVAPMAIFLFAAIAVSHRYTGDFCPFWISLAAFGAAGLELITARWRKILVAPIWFATVAAVFVTSALTLHHQGEEIWGVPDEVRQNYSALRQRVDAIFGGKQR